MINIPISDSHLDFIYLHDASISISGLIFDINDSQWNIKLKIRAILLPINNNDQLKYVI